MCRGVPFINPIHSFDVNDPTNRHSWGTQHDGLKFIEEPYLYHVVSILWWTSEIPAHSLSRTTTAKPSRTHCAKPSRPLLGDSSVSVLNLHTTPQDLAPRHVPANTPAEKNKWENVLERHRVLMANDYLAKCEAFVAEEYKDSKEDVSARAGWSLTGRPRGCAWTPRTFGRPSSGSRIS